MNANASLRTLRLSDRYDVARGAVWLTGTQALVRLPLAQRERDRRAGLDTAGYVSGYRGSPLGGYDQALQRARRQLEAAQVKFVPGLNEDLAATAIWGTQQVGLFPGAKHDGVFAIWYGKGPGVDRCGDVFRHANQSGTAPHGGVLALAGDDVGAKSSTVAAQTDFIFHAVSMPVLAPAGVQDYLDLGLHGFALSRFSGLWAGFKCVTDTVESAAVVEVDPDRPRIVLPTDFQLPPGGLGTRWPEEPFLKMEERLVRFKLPAAQAYARANRLDRVVWRAPAARLGFMASGKAWLDLMQAFADLGVTETLARELGIAAFKVSMPWPLEPEGARAFAEDVAELVVVEEKRALIETQLRELLYASPRRPTMWGKTDPQGRAWLPSHGELSPALLAPMLAERIAPLFPGGVLPERFQVRLRELQARQAPGVIPLQPVARIPYFCSGCPHNTSTRVPEGSRALAGIGCHFMSQWMGRDTATFTHMGGEGAAWIGQAPFTDTAHVFQNLGDGTYNHSGSLAIRHAVATGTRITYKILFNDAVAMTGGQSHEGTLTPMAIVRQVRAEGVDKVVVVTDEPMKYPAGAFPAEVSVHHRDGLDAVQRELREWPGVSVLVYDQTCAADKRRRRKKGEFPDPQKRVFINERVCEGCGDCGVQSNCMSILPQETEFGRKRRIDQSSCNKDYSCVKGFCPSFVTVEGGRLRRGRAAERKAAPADGLPEAVLPALPESGWSLLVTGIGGTGVVTIGQILGVAAHLDGLQATVLDMAGLAQKGGAVTSCVRFGTAAGALHAPRIGTASADALIGCDLVVSAGTETLARLAPGRARAVVNAARIPTAEFTANPDWQFPADALQQAVARACAGGEAAFLDATRLATALLGDAIATNLFMLGAAWQRGLVPVSRAAIEEAIRLNEVSIEQNMAAFAWGRLAVVDAAAVLGAAGETSATPAAAPSLDVVVTRRVEELALWQDAAWADRYRGVVERVRAAESALGDTRLTEAVAHNLFKLMSYKDEYEVARLHADGRFQAELAERFEGDYRVVFHLAPPVLGRRDAQGRPVKTAFGPWMMGAFKLLARMKRLRGTALDVFGRSAERRQERALIEQYLADLDAWLPRLSAANLDTMVELFSLPAAIRGFGHVKEAAVHAARSRREALLATLARPMTARALERAVA